MENGRIKEKKNRQEFEHNLPGPNSSYVPAFGHEHILKVSCIILAGLPSTMALAR